MDAHHRFPSPGRQSFLAPSQVIALGLVAASIGWAVWLLRDRPIREETELLSGSVLPSSELAIMEAAFDRAQLTDYRTDGGRVYVPRSRQSAYMRALVDAEALPREFGVSLRRALANNSPWQSKAVQAELLRVATQDELSLVLCSMPGIERAAVLYDVEEQTGLAGGTVKTASVSIRTQPESELDPNRVQAIRVLVAASIAGLSAERVAVTDLRSGRVFAGPLEDPAAAVAADPALARRVAYERVLASKVRQVLAYVKGAIVDVTVEFAEPQPALPVAPMPPATPLAAAAQPQPDRQKPADANAPAELAPTARTAQPTAAIPAAHDAPAPQPETAKFARGDVLDRVLVSIAVPSTYLQTALAVGGRGGESAPSDQAAAEAELGRIRELVGQMIPATADPAGRRVVVTTFPVASPPPVRREPTVRASAVPQPEPQPPEARADADLSLPKLIAQIAAGDRKFDPRSLPREVWLAATSIAVGLLSGFLWWAGATSRGYGAADALARHGTHPQQLHSQIDWSRADAGRRDDGSATEWDKSAA
jgi:type III secretory pathway lipoprotein EscJ